MNARKHGLRRSIVAGTTLVGLAFTPALAAELVDDPAAAHEVYERHQLQAQDESLAEQVALRVADRVFAGVDGIEAADDLLGGWKVTGDRVDLAIEATAGELRVTGTIDQLDRVDAIEQQARQVPGVKSVTSKVRLAGSDETSAMDVEDRAE